MQIRLALPNTTAVVAPPSPAVAPCPSCGPLAGGAPHREECFLGFQHALLVQYPSLKDACSVDEAAAIGRMFQFWTGIIHALRHRFPASADGCVERRWGETSGYVERLLARHARARAPGN